MLVCLQQCKTALQGNNARFIYSSFYNTGLKSADEVGFVHRLHIRVLLGVGVMGVQREQDGAEQQLWEISSPNCLFVRKSNMQLQTVELKTRVQSLPVNTETMMNDGLKSARCCLLFSRCVKWRAVVVV